MTLARTTRRKDDRLELRLEPANRRLLDEAATASSMSVSAFVLTHATDAARAVLADRTTFVLPDDRWDAFTELLERDARPMPGLAAFLATSSVLDEACADMARSSRCRGTMRRANSTADRSLRACSRIP